MLFDTYFLYLTLMQQILNSVNVILYELLLWPRIYEPTLGWE